MKLAKKKPIVQSDELRKYFDQHPFPFGELEKIVDPSGSLSKGFLVRVSLFGAKLREIV
jgi:hypothetical protein